MGQLGWARCTEDGAEQMRRGAWYEVLGEADADHLVIDVSGRRTVVHRSRVIVEATKPQQWSVVVRVGVLRPTWSNARQELRTTYAVCPSCRHRQEPEGRPAALTCELCQASFPIDWSRTC